MANEVIRKIDDETVGVTPPQPPEIIFKKRRLLDNKAELEETLAKVNARLAVLPVE
jgi:hypothetical protein